MKAAGAIFFIALLMVTMTSMATESARFSRGNEMRSVALSGEVQVTCVEPSGPAGNSQTVWFQCRDNVLVPAQYDYFVGPAGVDADFVTLQVHRADGSVRSRTIEYDSRLGMSAAKVNLWANTVLFQKPLLAFGINKVSYSLTGPNLMVALEGGFTAVVSEGGSLNCPRGQYSSSVAADCRQPFTICQRYFADKNFCQAPR